MRVSGPGGFGLTDRILSFLSSGPADPFNSFFETAPIMMQSIDANGQLLTVSTFLADTLGYTRDEMVGRKSSDFLTPASQAFAVEEMIPQFF